MKDSSENPWERGHPRPHSRSIGASFGLKFMVAAKMAALPGRSFSSLGVPPPSVGGETDRVNIRLVTSAEHFHRSWCRLAAMGIPRETLPHPGFFSSELVSMPAIRQYMREPGDDEAFGCIEQARCMGLFCTNMLGNLADPIREELQDLIRGEVLEEEPLALRTTYQIGGNARVLVCPKDLEDLRALNGLIRDRNLPKFVLGGGANVLFSDQGFHGIVIHLRHFDQLNFEGSRVAAGAGLNLDQFVAHCLKNGLAGVERLSGIPGTLGGALRMNAGAFDAEISDHLLTVEFMDQEGNWQVLEKDKIDFGYRKAPIIKGTYILGASFDFPSGSTEQLFRIREDILARRREKQPWQYPSAGSVFKRPPGHYAGKLIEDAGLKGKILGRAQISPKHAGIIINLGGATAEDVLGLIRLAQSEVRQKFNVELELEQELIGFEEQGTG